MLSTGGQELVDDLAFLISFSTFSIFVRDTNIANRLIHRKEEKGHQSLISRFFSREIICSADEWNTTNRLHNHLITLPREKFKKAMRAIRRYVLACWRTQDEPDLAYALFVMSIEALADQNKYAPDTWSDVPERVRLPLDATLPKQGQDKLADDAREAIRQFSGKGLFKSFQDVVLQNIDSAFFREDATQRLRPVSRLDLPPLLRKAYDIRSAFVHRQVPIPKQLISFGAGHDQCWVEGGSALTFDGLAHVSRTIIRNWIMSADSTKAEEYNWRDDLPNIVRVQLSNKYWAGKTEGFSEADAPHRLRALLEDISYILLEFKGSELTNFSKLCSLIEKFMRNKNRTHNIDSLIAIYIIFQHYIYRGDVPSRELEYIESFRNILNECRPIQIIVSIATFKDIQWSGQELDVAWNEYVLQRHTKGGHKWPALFEAAWRIIQAEKFFYAGNITASLEAVAEAVECWPGYKPLIDFEGSFSTSKLEKWPRWWEVLLPNTTVQDASE